jgi:hypothetical protein
MCPSTLPLTTALFAKLTRSPFTVPLTSTFWPKTQQVPTDYALHSHSFAGGQRQSKPGLSLLIALVALSLPSFGLERRHQDFLIVPASETVDDTLFALATMLAQFGVCRSIAAELGRRRECAFRAQ